jgi:pimeloyl-ACP methyl ester carboxylesterase
VRSCYLPDWDAVIRYHDLPGSEPAVVFLHGLGAAGSSEAVGVASLPPFARRRRLLIDLLGFGYSDRPRGCRYRLTDHARSVAAVLDGAGVTGSHLVGHSMGGTVALTLAALRPDLVSALVVAEGNLDPGVGTGSVEIAAWSEADYVARGHDFMLGRLAAEARAGDAVMGVYAAAFRLAAPHAVHRSAVGLLARTRPTARESLYDFSGPRAFVFGERSLPDPDRERLAEHGVAVLVVPGAGHAMLVEAPQAFARVVGRFLRRAVG